jgi:hypothetical protein
MWVIASIIDVFTISSKLSGRKKIAALHDAPYANFARNICVTYAPDSRRIQTGCARHIREFDTNVACTCRATRDVTFGPLYLYIHVYRAKRPWISKCPPALKKHSLHLPSCSASPNKLNNWFLVSSNKFLVNIQRQKLESVNYQIYLQEMNDYCNMTTSISSRVFPYLVSLHKTPGEVSSALVTYYYIEGSDARWNWETLTTSISHYAETHNLNHENPSWKALIIHVPPTRHEEVTALELIATSVGRRSISMFTLPRRIQMCLGAQKIQYFVQSRFWYEIVFWKMQGFLYAEYPAVSLSANISRSPPTRSVGFLCELPLAEAAHLASRVHNLLTSLVVVLHTTLYIV